jgi:hypothetical protein
MARGPATRDVTQSLWTCDELSVEEVTGTPTVLRATVVRN